MGRSRRPSRWRWRWCRWLFRGGSCRDSLWLKPTGRPVDASTSSVQIFQETSFVPIAWKIGVGTIVARGPPLL
jgi:hypothetical protein